MYLINISGFLNCLKLNLINIFVWSQIYTHSRYEIPRAFEDTWSQEPVEMYDSYM